jgi:hypothetical protein
VYDVDQEPLNPLQFVSLVFITLQTVVHYLHYQVDIQETKRCKNSRALHLSTLSYFASVSSIMQRGGNCFKVPGMRLVFKTCQTFNSQIFMYCMAFRMDGHAVLFFKRQQLLVI